jgi:hypothetical protein
MSACCERVMFSELRDPLQIHPYGHCTHRVPLRVGYLNPSTSANCSILARPTCKVSQLAKAAISPQHQHRRF